MYDRKYDDKELQFETSGGLLHASLVMRDAQTDSWWSIMTGDAIGGSMQGQKLKELPSLGEKSTWGDWRARYPDTVVLSVDGVEHDDSNPYDNYFSSDRTFRGMQVEDDRLPPKESIFSFQYADHAYAVSHQHFAGGGVFEFEDDTRKQAQIFVYRPDGASFYLSSVAFRVPRDLVQKKGDTWGFRDAQGWATIGNDDALQRLAAVRDVTRLSGFDTFWYNWVAVHNDTVVLE